MTGPSNSRNCEWDAMAGAYASAAERTGEHIVRRAVAGLQVEVRFAGPALIPYVLPAFDHLPELSPGPDLVIRAWESAATGVALPPEAGVLSEHTRRGLPGEGPVDGIATSFLFGSGGLSFYRTATGEAYYWMPSAAATPYYDRCTPLKAILHWFLGERGAHILHGGVVGEAGRGVLIAGGSGAGKSTTCLASLSGGLDYVSDDHCALTWDGDGAPVAQSIYASGKLTVPSLELLPEFKPQVANAASLATEKGLLLLTARYRAQLPVRARLAAMVVLAQTTGRPRIESIGGGAALTALAPSTLLQLPGARAEALRQMGRLARVLPAFRLHLGDDVRAVPDAIRNLLQSVGPPVPAK
ncbi:MAG: hypothetical protein ACKVVT_09020 [Dehalococcoidia bacterium]